MVNATHAAAAAGLAEGLPEIVAASPGLGRREPVGMAGRRPARAARVRTVLARMVLARAALALLVVAGLAVAPGPARAAGAGTAKAMSLYAKGDYMGAAALLTRLAEAGDARAQAMLGLLYELGHGVPQDFAVAAWWYGCAAERGDANGQYLLGLAYDKGRGVPRDVVLSQKWLILAAARADRQEQAIYIRIRNAVATKMSLAQLALAQQLALQWTPTAPSVAP